MPAKPRPRLAVAGFRDRAREPVDRDFVARDLLEPERLRDVFRLDRLADPLELDRLALVSPFSRRILFTVRAATSSARPP
jgi:hypothetical protein